MPSPAYAASYAAAAAFLSATQSCGVAAAELAAQQASEDAAARSAADLAEAMSEVYSASRESAAKSRCEVEAQLATLAGITNEVNIDDSSSAINDLARQMGRSEAALAADDAAFSRLMCEPGFVVRIGGASQLPARSTPPSAIRWQLGPKVIPPGPAADLHASARSGAPSIRSLPFAGVHLSVQRLGGLYRHHGIALGDGTVAHFSGAEGDFGSAEVIRTPFEQFLAGSDASDLRAHYPVRTAADAPVPSFLPNLVALRALQVVGQDGYHLVRSNCEHLAAWAQFGALQSGQVDRKFRSAQIASASAIAPAVGPTVMAAYLAAWTTQIESQPLTSTPPSASVPSSQFVLEVGRVLWAKDQQELVWWLPALGSADPANIDQAPFGPPDRPWCAGRPNSGSVWHADQPSILLDRGWQASVVATPDGELFVIDCDGTWRRPGVNLWQVIEPRMGPIIAVNQALARRDDVFKPVAGKGARFGPGQLKSLLA